MRRQQFFQLLAGEQVTLKSVVVSWAYEGWFWYLLSFIWRRSVSLDLSVLIHKGQKYIMATRPDGRKIKIPHRMIFEAKRPESLWTKWERSFWYTLRDNFSREIAAYVKQVQSAKKSTSPQGTENEMVVLPSSSAISSSAETSSTLLMVDDPDGDLEEGFNPTYEKTRFLGDDEAIEDQLVKTLRPSHLTIMEPEVGPLFVPTSCGAIRLHRAKSIGGGTYRIWLEAVPFDHELYRFFLKEKLANRNITIWIGRDGLMSSVEGTPPWHLASYLKRSFVEDPGKQRVDKSFLCG